MRIPKSVFAISRVCSRDDAGRVDIPNVRLERDGGEGKPVAVATDGSALVVAAWSELPADEMPQQMTGGNGHVDVEAITVDREAWENAGKAVEKRSTLPVVTVANAEVVSEVNGKRVEFRSLDTALNARTTVALASESYPDWRGVFPEGEPSFVVHFDPRLVMETLKAMVDVIGATKKDDVSFAFEFRPAEAAADGKPVYRPVVVRSTDRPYGDVSVKALIMPQRPPEK